MTKLKTIDRYFGKVFSSKNNYLKLQELANDVIVSGRVGYFDRKVISRYILALQDLLAMNNVINLYNKKGD